MPKIAKKAKFAEKLEALRKAEKDWTPTQYRLIRQSIVLAELIVTVKIQLTIHYVYQVGVVKFYRFVQFV